MPPAPRIRKKRATQVSLVTSLVFHGAIIAALVFFAAREGYLGKQLKTIAVTMAPKEKPPEPEKPKEPEKKPEPQPEKPKVDSKPEPQVAPPRAVVPAPSASANLAPPPVAPPPGQVAGFNFSDGAKVVESSSDPVQLFKGFVEFTLRSKWQRPEGLQDSDYIAEVELKISKDGQVTGSEWRRGSGHAAWDQSVRQAVAQTPRLGRVPPKGFPDRVVVRCDVVTEVDSGAIALP